MTPSPAHFSAANPPWFQRGYRRMLVDMHIPDWDPAFLAHYDVTAMAVAYERAGLTSAMIYCQSHVGLCNWPTQTGKMHAGLHGRDITGELVAELRRRHIDVCAYYSVIFNNWAFLEYPDWRIQPAHTTAVAGSRYGNCCPNNPGYRAFALGQTTELAGGYAFDGLFFDMTFWPAICVCEHCRKRFRQEAGQEIPATIDWFSPAWCAFQNARERWMAEFADALTHQAKTTCPGLIVYHNFATAASHWIPGVPFASSASHDFLGADFYGDALEQLMVSKFMGGLSRQQPIEFMTSCCVNLRDHVRLKSADEMRRQAFAATLFSGAFLFIDAINPDGTLSAAMAERIGSIYAETAPYEPFLGGHFVAEIALYFSDDSRMDFNENGRTLADDPLWDSKYPHNQAIRGCCRILQAAHLPYTIITRKDLPELANYRVVALPNVLRLTTEEVAAFRQYVRNGGRLYASGQTSLTESCGTRHADFLLADLFGCHAVPAEWGNLIYLKPATADVAAAIAPQTYLSYFQTYSPTVPGQPAGDRAVPLAGGPEGDILATVSLPYACPHPGSVLDQNWASIHSSPPWQDSTTPALVRNVFGQGVSVYAAAALEAVDCDASNRLVEKLFRELLGPRPAFSAEAHPAVWMNVQHVPERQAFTIAFLNSQTQVSPLPVPELAFTLRTPQGMAFTRLLELPGRTPVPFIVDAVGDLQATVQNLSLFRMLQAEYAPV
ncbi:MAG: alpha-amylase family protein [Lentisphaeria bacterium]